MAKFLIPYTIILLFYCTSSIICQLITPRKTAGCALIHSTIYCYGGHPLNNAQSLNVQHVSLALTQLHGINDLDDTKIQWNNVTDTINSTQTTIRPRFFQGSALVTSDNSYIMYGGAVADPFLNFNPQSYTWKSLQVDPNVNLTFRNTIVNMGDDMFWIWGGNSIPNTTISIPNIAYIYDYKEKWINQIVENNVPVRTAHTATLGLDNAIYVLGGIIKNPDGNYSNINFNGVMKFDTKLSRWSYFTATGHSASPRAIHTATHLPNRNQIFIYGGGNSPDESLPKDDCLIFDYKENIIHNINLPIPNAGKGRYGHFAEIYNETYLVMAFGFLDEIRPAPSLSILNISNPFNPQRVTSFPAVSTSENNLTLGLSSGVIAAIIVPIVIIILTAIAMFIYFYKKQEKKYKFPKDPFILDETNSELNIKGTRSNDDDGVKYAKLTIDHENVEGYNKINDVYPTDVFCKPLENTNDQEKEEQEEGYNKINDDHPTDAYWKPLESIADGYKQDNVYIKPSED